MADEIRTKLRLPVAVVVVLAWIAGCITAIVEADIQVFVISSGPFTILMGYLFTDGILKRAQNGNGHG